ncbi:MAG: hypothetical protein ABIS50_11565 [Luteolibacter sp.]|uniref:hypothetical protein n=1 Tax=Luteolibacter sp. TaxID=1962973 RepID=UPI003265BB17
MIRLEVNVRDLGVGRQLAGMAEALADKEGLHAKMAENVETSLIDHLHAQNSRSPNSNYFAKAAESVEVEADENHATVRITRIGMALHYNGGTVLPGQSISSFTGEPTKAQAIPTDDVPRQGPENERASPREMGLLAFIPNRKGTGTIGYLVEGEEKEITRGSRKGGKRIVPKPGGDLFFVLRSWTTHLADESVLPTLIALQEAARDGGLEHINSYTDV